MKMLTQTSVTSDQLKHITRVGTDAVEKAIVEFVLDKDGAQRVHAHGDEFAAAIHTVVIATLKDLSVPDKYRNEEEISHYNYFSGYKPKGLTEQTTHLRELFFGIGYANQELLAQIEKGEVELPANAEGWFAIPTWMKHPEIFGTTYSEALLKVLDVIKQAYEDKFCNYREGQINEEQLRQSVRSQKFFIDIAKAQGDPDILIVPAQFGIHHRGRSVRCSREVFAFNEFGLGAFAVGVMILTHLKRLMHYDDLWIDCSGDEFDDPDSNIRFGRTPSFDFRNHGVKFGTRSASTTHIHYGSASGLVL